MENGKRPLNRSITAGCVLFIIALCVLLSLANLGLYRTFVYNDYRDYIANILNYTKSHIDCDDLETCIKTGEESDAYKETLLFMDDLMNHYDDVHYFYAILPLNTNDTGNTMSVLSAERYHDRYEDTEGNLYLGWVSDDEYDAETAAKMFDIMKGNDIVYFEEVTEWGTDYTGAMPLKNSAGKGIAVLAVDIDISFINGMIAQYAMVNIGVVVLAGVIFIALFLFWSRKNITMPIQELEQSVVRFADHSHGQRDTEALSFDAPEMKKNNEIKSLSNAVAKMTKDMRDYVDGIVNAEKEAATMQELANRDALTGVRNKTAYDAEAKRVEAAIANGETRVGLAIVDLNFLKKINDTYGHEKGDAAIKRLCQLTCKLFEHSPVFRIGGDEFAIILRGEDYNHCNELVDRFYTETDKMSTDVTLASWEKISAAIGVAFYDSTLDNGLDSLFRRADQAMYEKKKAMNALRAD